MEYKLELITEDSTHLFYPTFEFGEEIYLIQKYHKKYVIVKGEVEGIWATNIAGLTIITAKFGRLYLDEDESDLIFKKQQLEEAKKKCIELNQQAKITVYQ